MNRVKLNKVINTINFQLLSKPKYSSIEKIKTIGSSYMVAAGLSPGAAAAVKKEVLPLFQWEIMKYFSENGGRVPGSESVIFIKKIAKFN